MRMKRFFTLLMIMALVFTWNCTSAFAIGDWLGGLTSVFSANDEKVYGVGEKAEGDDVTATLINVMQSSGNSYYKPESGKEFLILEFTIENHTKEDIVLSTALCFSMQCDGEYCVIDTEALATAMFAGKYQLDCAVEPGKKVTGVVGYQVQKNWKKFTIKFSPEIYFGDKLTFGVER